MAEVLPPASQGVVQIEHQDLQPGFQFRTQAGIYAGLKIGNVLWMSDTDDERAWNQDVLQRSRGDVLIAGLGLGMVVLPIIEKAAVNSVTVIERNADVVALVRPHLEAFAAPGSAVKLKIVVADINKWRPQPLGRSRRLFDAIYFDIWPDICTDYLDDMKILHATFRPFLRRGGWVGSWQYEHLRECRRDGRWR